ncbi:MAG: LON peptidase substrate-binding domain-containing protein, partial [Planctomycetota bacterium]|nr:LON peptidase substrate-binding domain-containing protein [Planctomycetota bacterium]
MNENMDAAGSLPLFPLPQVLLYPEAVVPLHLFEPRYRQMIADMISAGEDRLVIAALRPGYESTYFDSPPVYEIGGVGKLLKCHRLADGRWNVVLQGERRVKILDEITSGRLYRRVRVMELIEPKVTEDEPADLREHLCRALRALVGSDICIPECAHAGYLADVLLLQLPLS